MFSNFSNENLLVVILLVLVCPEMSLSSILWLRNDI